jgi:hypothetical protein
MLFSGREISEDPKIFNFEDILLSHDGVTKNQVF